MISEKLANAMRWFDDHADRLTPDMIDMWRTSMDGYIAEVRQLEDNRLLNLFNAEAQIRTLTQGKSPPLAPSAKDIHNDNMIQIAKILDRQGVGVGKPKNGWRIHTNKRPRK